MNKGILKSIGIKVGILLCISIPLSSLVAYCDDVSFFTIMKVLAGLFIIMGIAGFLPSERVAINNFRNPNIFTEDKYYAKGKKPYYERILRGNMIVFNKGAMQIIIAAIIIIGLTFLSEGVTKTKTFTDVFGNKKVKTMIIIDEENSKTQNVTKVLQKK